jgi:hypothetical protein
MFLTVIGYIVAAVIGFFAGYSYRGSSADEKRKARS